MKVQEIQYRIPGLEGGLDDVVAAELECKAANVEENDYTIFTCQDLQFELELVMHSIQKKITFVENQVNGYLYYFLLLLIVILTARSCRGI